MSGSLPTGTVTFLLTDIEGSTRAWQSEGGGLEASIQRHYEVLDRWVGASGGARPEEQGEGDSVVAVFADARDALDAAIGAQRELLAELPDLPVRMALHTGEAQLRNERNYVGLSVIRCARIRSCGHGGQILLSQATVDAVGDRLPAGVDVRSLGRYGLKGLTGRTEIAQIVAPGLPDAFPPLTAGASAAGNLPRPVSSFLGRRAELADLTALLDERRWVTVTGDGGVGKSRLALAGAAAAAEAHPGGTWWVPLAHLDGGSVDDVAAAIASACSCERRGDALDDVTGFFGSLAASLLVLDGADGVTASVVAVLERLLTGAVDLRVLVTSRDAAAVVGETAFHLQQYDPPTATTSAELAASDAGELFLDRLRGAGGPASLTSADVAAVVRICRRWRTAADLELVAIRAGSTPLTQLADELEHLGDSAPSALASSSAWHLRALGDDERVFLQRCSVFHRSVPPDAALVVAVGDGLDGEAAGRALARLVERGVVRDDGERLHLHDRFRKVVRTWPSDAGHREATGRYVDWCATVADRFEAGGATLPVSWLVDDLADVMAAVEIACRTEMPDAYRLLRSLAPRWHELDRWPELWAASSWLATRSPSDGELEWVAAVARVSFAAAGRPDAAVHSLREEARAVAVLDRDEVSCDFLAFGPSAAALADGDPSAAVDLFDGAAARGTEPVALAIADRLVASPFELRRSEIESYLAGRAEGTGHRDPIRAAAAHLADRRDDGASTV